jgi:hypothetical protein
MWQARRESKLKDFIAISGFWSGDEFAAELDAALHRWFNRAPRRHALWYQDLNYLAYGLVHARRTADAKAVFEAIGPYAESVPWAWMPEVSWSKSFLTARRTALRA